MNVLAKNLLQFVDDYLFKRKSKPLCFIPQSLSVFTIHSLLILFSSTRRCCRRLGSSASPRLFDSTSVCLLTGVRRAHPSRSYRTYDVTPSDC
jgi:hypothetical protein